MLSLHYSIIYMNIFYNCEEKWPSYNKNVIVYDVLSPKPKPRRSNLVKVPLSQIIQNPSLFSLSCFFAGMVWMTVLIFYYTSPEEICSQILFVPNVQFLADSLANSKCSVFIECVGICQPMRTLTTDSKEKVLNHSGTCSWFPLKL